MNIGDKIKELRKSKGLTQKELSFALNKSERMIQKYENGDVIPRFKVIEEITDYFELDIKQFLEFEKYEIDYVGIGEKIREVSIERGLMNVDLAKMLGCSTSVFSNYLSAERKISIGKIKKLSDILQYDFLNSCNLQFKPRERTSLKLYTDFELLAELKRRIDRR